MSRTGEFVCCRAGVTSDFCVNTLLARPVGLEEINMSIPKPSDVDLDNIQEVTEDQLKAEDKAELDQRMKEYKKLCLLLKGIEGVSERPKRGRG